ncbi:DNA helicase RecQ [Gynuella sunshinyii]|uniref:DNA helicase RecQ n=1 Tax=Gynuella sunshinyii YC6258 TaxID=1445510 RepID=A0A0C5VU70_9GAMM|nr:DNA helicase RecQ [Gynuella sunshinyii]AJQ96848.1 superfamily II DNA helicase [Gynuella sunshinyii YC6258]
MLQQALYLLEHTYGYSAFRGQQQHIIESALAGEDVLVLMPTGGGKSLCYQIPALIRPGLGIIVSPLIALMQDQVSTLTQLGIKAAFLNSTLSADERRTVAYDLRQGNIDLLYIAPERLLQPGTLQWLQQFQISLIAIDEAHCVSQWGHDFRADYLQLNQLREAFPGVPRIALTATATPRTQEEIVQRLELNAPKQFVSSFDRPNIRYSVQAKQDGRKQLIKFLATQRGNSGIIYCLSRKKVEATSEWLQSRGLNALPYHAGLPTELRAHHLTRFLREEEIIMVATIAFGMGIDKPDVRFVAHLDLPKSMEAYYQETGRAGRDGEPAEAWMVYGLNDVMHLSQMVDRSEAHEIFKRNEKAKLEALLGWCEETSCRRRSLLAYFGEQHETDCGNCDTCLTPPKTWDATEPARKLLSCIYRTGQRFGAGHVIDVLRGKMNERMKDLGHNHLSVFNIGAQLSEQKWRSIVRQLLVKGFIHSDADQYGAISLMERSRPLLRGEIQLFLREDIDSKPENMRKTKTSRYNEVSDNDRELWQALRACRKTLADEFGIAPYMVFHDATLMEMMEYRPETADQLLGISGVGESKLEKFGDAFLEVLREHAE